MNKAYVDINWENYPSENTPLNEDNLNKMVSAINLNGENIQSLDVSKATIEEVKPLVKDVARDENTGIVTVTKKDGSTSKFGTGLDTSKQLHLSLYNSDYDPTLEPSSSYFIDKVATLVTGDKNYQHLCIATADQSGGMWLQSIYGGSGTANPSTEILDLNPLGGDVRVNKSKIITESNMNSHGLLKVNKLFEGCFNLSGDNTFTSITPNSDRYFLVITGYFLMSSTNAYFTLLIPEYEISGSACCFQASSCSSVTGFRVWAGLEISLYTKGLNILFSKIDYENSADNCDELALTNIYEIKI